MVFIFKEITYSWFSINVLNRNQTIFCVHTSVKISMGTDNRWRESTSAFCAWSNKSVQLHRDYLLTGCLQHTCLKWIAMRSHIASTHRFQINRSTSLNTIQNFKHYLVLNITSQIWINCIIVTKFHQFFIFEKITSICNYLQQTLSTVVWLIPVIK